MKFKKFFFYIESVHKYASYSINKINDFIFNFQFSILSIKGWEIILKINCCINQIIFRWRKTYTSLNMYKDNDKNINWNLKSIKLLLWCLTSYGYIVARFVLLCSQFLILIHNIVVLYRSQHPSKGRKKAWKFEGGGGSSNVSPLIKIGKFICANLSRRGHCVL